MTIILEEKFDVGTDVYGDFIRRYHESIIRRLDKFHSGMGIVGPANLTGDSRWSTVSVTNLSGRSIEIAKCLESLWVFGYRCGPSHPWGLVTESAEKDFSSLPGRHMYLDFDGNYPNALSDLNVSRSSLDNAITVLDIYAKAFNENRKPNNGIEAQRCFIILVIYFAEALRIVPIRDLLQKEFELYKPNVLIDGVNMDLARNWDKISLGFLSGSYSKLEGFGIHNQVTLKQKLWLIYNRKTPLHELDGVRPNGWLGDPGNGGDAGAPEGKSGRRGHSGDGGPSSGANQGDSKNCAGGGQSRDQVAGRGSRLPKGKRCSIELFNKLLIKIQFGMVIEYLFEQFPNWEDVGNQAIGDLQAARKEGWLLPAKEKKFPRVSHVGFGLVLGSDGKRFRTRSSEVVRLVELLDEAKTQSKAELIQRLENNENGEDNTIVGFGVEKVSLFEKITIQAGAETQELAPQYIMVCLTCEGKLIMYHIARASDPSELPQSNIADFDLNGIEENKSATVSEIPPTKEPLSVLSNKGEEPKTREDNQSKMASASVGSTIQPPISVSTGATLTTTITESKIPNKTDSPFKGGFGGFSAPSPMFSTGPAFNAAVAESKTSSETTSPFRGTSSLGTQNITTPQPFNLPTNAAPNTANQMSSSFKGPFGFGTHNAPAMQSLGNFSASTASGISATGSMTTSQKTSSFRGAFGPVNQNAFATQPLSTFSTGATPTTTAAESKTPSQTTSPFKGAFGGAFGSISGSTQKEGSSTAPQQSMKPFSSVSGTAQNEGFFAGSQPSFKPFSGTGLKLGSTEPGSDGSALSKFGEKSPSLSIGVQNKPIRNIEATPASRGSFAAAKEGFSAARYEQTQVKTTSDSSATTTKDEVESEQELSNDLYSVKDMTKELDKLLLSIGKEVEITSQQFSLLALDKHLKSLSESSLICKNNVEEQLQMIQDLWDKMSQVSSRLAYMEGIVNQSSDSRYWNVWNCQKLAPEFEQKRQNILKANQNLTTQLVELERHFNTLMINLFGEVGRAGFNRRNVYNHPGSSKQTQSLHSVYNTLNSQLAAAEQLSECLTKQISILNLGPPSPSPSKPAGLVKKQLFESIGLSYEPESYTSPDVPRPVNDSSSVKRIFTSVKDYRRRSSVGPAKGVELETARRRRESLNKSWASVEPQKTTVKRVEKQLQPVQQKRFSIGSDKKFKSSREIFRKDTEAATIHQTSCYGSPVSLLLEPSNTKLNVPPLTQGIEEEAPNQAAMPQQGVAFRWAREVSSPFPNLEPKARTSQEKKATGVVMEQPKFIVSSQALATGTSSRKKEAGRRWLVSLASGAEPRGELQWRETFL